MSTNFSSVQKPMDPRTWAYDCILTYLHIHGLEGTASSGGKLPQREERARLVQLVENDINNFYSKRWDKSAQVPFDDVLGMDPEVLLVRGVPPEAAALLRQHPEKLRSVLAVGLEKVIAEREGYMRWEAPKLHDNNVLSQVEQWLSLTVDDEGQKLMESEAALRVCGRSFQPGEVLVYCRDCALDSSCVFCGECFKRSPCVNHSYVVRQSMHGGGICDCGDASAWKPSSFCLHHRGFQGSEDPAAEMDAAKRLWLEVLASGVVSYTAMVVGMHAQFLSCRTSDDELPERVQWFDRALRRVAAIALLLSNTGEGPRRILCLSLMEKATVPRFVERAVEGQEVIEKQVLSYLEELFLYDFEVPADSSLLVWERSILFLFDNTLCDPLFRVPFAELLLKYAERGATANDVHVTSLAVQVFTSSNVIDDLLLRKPHPKWKSLLGGETVLHRLIFCMLYCCCMGGGASEQGLSSIVSAAVRCCRWITEVLTVTPNANALVVSLGLYRGWCKMLTTCGTGGLISRKEASENLSSGFTAMGWLVHMELELQLVFYRVAHMAYDVAVSLHLGEPPFPPQLLETLSSSSWGCVWDPSVRFGERERLLDSVSLQGGSVLLVEASGRGHGTSYRGYMRELLKESIVTINDVLKKKREDLPRKETIFWGLDGGSLLEWYDLLDGELSYQTLFVIPHMRFFGEMVKSWVRVQKRIGEKAAEVDEEPFTCLLLELFAQTGARMDYWIDECLMPLVLLCQHEQGLWRRDGSELSVRCSFYVSWETLLLEADVCMIQLLMLLTPTETFSAQLLSRFIFSDENRTLGYPGFLRLILTLCVQDCGPPINGKADLVSSLKRLLLHAAARDDGCALASAEGIINQVEKVFPGVTLKDVLPGILQEAVSLVRRPRGAVLELKDVYSWHRHINLYHPTIRDRHLPDMCEVYELLVRRGQMATGNGTEGNLNDTSVVLPPPSIKWVEISNEHEGESVGAHRGSVFRNKVFLLLQDPCVLSVAIRAVHGYACSVVDGDAAHESVISNFTLVHAVSVLYLAMKVCSTVGFRESGGDHLGPINWDAVRKFRKENTPPSVYAPGQLEQLLGLEMVLNAECLSDVLQVPLEAEMLVKGIPASARTTSAATTAERLLMLRDHFQKGVKDMFGVAGMIDFILHGVGKPSSSATDMLKRGKPQHDQAERRRLDVKERQSALLKRMKSINERKSAALLREVSRIETASDARVAAVEPDTSGAECQLSVMAVMLRRFQGMECCLCRCDNNEALMLFGNLSVSDVLDRLRFDDLAPEPRRGRQHKLSVHLYLCGHAAHSGCVNKIAARQEAMRAAGRSQENVANQLIHSEFHCPMCLMVCTILYPLSTVAVDTAVQGTSSIFEALRCVASGTNATCLALQEFRRSVTLLATSVLCDDSGDSRPLNGRKKPREGAEDFREVIEVARCVRAQMCAALEWVKAGGALRCNELLTFLSLMISLMPALLGELIFSACEEFSPDNDDDGFCILLLNTLMYSQNTSEYVTQYTTLLLHSCDVSALSPISAGGGGGDKGNSLLMSMWRELGCLTLLKVLLTDKVPSELTRVDDDNVLFVPFQSERLTTREGQEQAVFIMLRYLLQAPLQTSASEGMTGAEDLITLIRKVASEGSERGSFGTMLNLPHCRRQMLCSRSPRFRPMHVVYKGALLWRQFLMNHVLHLPDSHSQLLLSLKPSEPCSICGATEGRRFMCCFCGELLCHKPLERSSELRAHAETCGNGLGIYMNTENNRLQVVQNRNSVSVAISGPYADEYGRRMAHSCLSCPLTLNDKHVQFFLSLWIRSRWRVESTVVQEMGLLGRALQ